MPPYLVSNCICHERSFEEIKEWADEHDCERIEELQHEDISCNGCGLCIPYLELMLETGDTEFEPGAHYRRSR